MARDPQQTLSSHVVQTTLMLSKRHGEQNDEVSQGGAQRNGCSKSSSIMCYRTLDPTLSMEKGRGVLAKASWGKSYSISKGLGMYYQGLGMYHHPATPPHLHSPHLATPPHPHSLLTPPHVTHQKTEPQSLIHSESQDTCPSV